MELRQLRYFLDIAETEHLTQSAQNLFVTQSTLSHGLRQLETELDVSLFDRLGRGLKLSQAGAQFRGFALRALKELEAGRMALSDLSGLQTGTLTMGIFPTFLNTVLPATVAAFHHDHPRVSVVVRALRARPIEEELLRGELDVGIGFHPTLHKDIETEPLFDERLILAVHPEHLLASCATCRLRDLSGLSLALLSRSFATRRQIDGQFRQAGVEPRVKVEMESVEALLGVCRWSRDLATIVPERAIKQYPDVQAIPLDAPGMVRSAGLLWRLGASRSAAAQAFACRLREIDWDQAAKPSPVRGKAPVSNR